MIDKKPMGFFEQIRSAISGMIWQPEIPFNIIYTKIKEDGEYPPMPYKFIVLAEFDLPGTDRHYAIYINRGSNN